MSTADAKAELAFMNAIDVLKNASVDEETLHAIQSGRTAMVMINSTASMLMDRSDPKAAENYVSLTMVGVRAPFDRMKVELVKTGKLSSTDKVEKYHAMISSLLNFLDHATDIDEVHRIATDVRVEVDKMQAPQRREESSE